MRRHLALLVLVFTLPGCGVARTANDVRLELCDHLGAEQKQAIRAQAAKEGSTFDVIYALWRASCLIRVKAAMQEAVGAIGATKP